MTRLASFSRSLSLFALVTVSGCAGARWSVVDSRPLMAVSVARPEIHGAVDKALVTRRYAALVAGLRAHGYQILDAPAAGVPTLIMKVDGTIIDDSQMHAPDDCRHNIVNDLHYSFVSYKVQLDVVDAGGHLLAGGSASADADPSSAISALAARLVRDVPAASSNYASR